MIKILERKCNFVDSQKLEICKNQAVKMKLILNQQLAIFRCVDHEKEVKKILDELSN